VTSHANGGKAKSMLLMGRLIDGGRVTFATTIDPLLFTVGSLKGKYRLIRIAIRNDGTQPLPLSAGQDKVTLEVAGRQVPALLDLSASDPSLWDSLPQDLRTMLAYPVVVDGGEEESVVAYVPVGVATQAPTTVTYTNASKNEPVVLEAPRAAH
jgi:hypothetical protein